MPKRPSIKDAATAGTSVIEQITRGNAQDVQDVQNAQNAKAAKDSKKTKTAPPLERLNLKIPADIKEYLTIAAAKASIEQRRSISLTEYLCDLVRADRQKRNAKEFTAALDKKQKKK